MNDGKTSAGKHPAGKASAPKVRNVTRGSPKSTLEIRLFSCSLSLHLVTMYALNSGAYSGPDSVDCAGLLWERPILHLQAGFCFPARDSLRTRRRGGELRWQTACSGKHPVVVSRRSFQGFVVILEGPVDTAFVRGAGDALRRRTAHKVMCSGFLLLWFLDFCCYGFWIFVVMFSGFLLLCFLDFCCYVFWIFVVMFSGFFWYEFLDFFGMNFWIFLV